MSDPLLPDVTVRVTGFEAGQNEARRLHCFSILSHPWGWPRVHLESYGGGRWITDSEEVGYFAYSFEHGAKVAFSPKESRRFVLGMAKEWENRSGG
ncbi:Scr1 family TA system antitoxin-like transcriptional regulator [Nocardia jiangsuensis]|uniref:Scr1 family TA system antitoxin-like transcriptional regulator n=1 Tax=Nocardia jiangsuensis TaxID=1691563 RepID=A0ABV8DTS8_9NOCA